MITVSVIIPFYQRQAGILRRALLSVLQQRLSPGVQVTIIVIDDGSPVSADAEAQGLAFNTPFHLIIIPQPNSGVAAARNTGLQAVDGSSTYIAFLDSDDSWHVDHLNHGLEALEAGNDLYFCDNRREGVHDSNFALGKRLIIPYVQDSRGEALVTLPAAALFTIILQDSPAQASTIVYRRAIAPSILFDTSSRNAGENLIFFLHLVSATHKPCFSPQIMVECGPGVNIYFSNLNWNSDGNLRRVMDRLRAYLIIKHTVPLSEGNDAWNDSFIATLRRNLFFTPGANALGTRDNGPLN